MINRCYTRAFIQIKSSYLHIFISFKPLKRDKQGWQVMEIGCFWSKYDYFCTNWPKETSLTSFKTVSDVHKQYTLLCEIFRMRTISQNTVSQCMSFFQLYLSRLNCSGPSKAGAKKGRSCVKSVALVLETWFLERRYPYILRFDKS